MSSTTLSTIATSQHERIDAALQRAENATYGGSREAFAAYDELVAELTRHLFAMEVAVLPVAARSLPGGAGELRPQIDRLRQLETIELRIEERRSKPPKSVEALRRRLVDLMEAHRREETRILAELDAVLDGAERDQLAERFERASLRSPTRPHPHAVRRLVMTRWLYRPVGAWDRMLDTMDSRTVPPLRKAHRRAAESNWDSYLLGRPRWGR